MIINFQNALTSSFRNLFQCFQKIWQVSTTLLPKIFYIFQRMLPGSQNWLPKLDPKPLPTPPINYFRNLSTRSVVNELKKVG